MTRWTWLLCASLVGCGNDPSSSDLGRPAKTDGGSLGGDGGDGGDGGAPSGTTACAQFAIELGDNASLGGFLPFPSTHAWNTNIASASVDPQSDAITADPSFAGGHLHHDFAFDGGGMPYVVVDSSMTASVPVQVEASLDQSDIVVAPLTADTPIEGDPGDCVGGPDDYVGDQHVLVIDRATCELYELFNATRCMGTWKADAETLWDLETGAPRPWGWTSADAAGLSVLAGILRYDEVQAGVIRHAIRYTMPATFRGSDGSYFVPPASHGAGLSSTTKQVMGQRLRLKQSFDISGFSPTNQVILTAMKQYGLILADNGGAFFFQGTPDARWDDDDLENLDAIPSSDFEVVASTPAYPGYDDASLPTGAAPQIASFTASSSAVAAGASVTLSWSTSDDGYDFIDVVGPVRGTSVTVTPTATTTYTLEATNAYGRTTQALTITVN